MANYNNKSEEIDKQILQAIKEFKGIPTPYALARVLRYSNNFISQRIESNKILKDTQTEVSLAYINSLSIEKLAIECAKINGLNSVCKDYSELTKRIYERIDDEHIFPAIKKFKGMPNPEALSRVLSYSSGFISERIESNPILSKAQIEVGSAYIKLLSIEKLAEECARKKGRLISACSDFPELKKRIYERIDNEHILPAIKDFKGVPTPNALSRVLPFGNSFILQRIKSNSILSKAQIEVGLAYINNLSIEQLAQGCTTKSSLIKICKDQPELQKKIYERIDNELILPAINDFKGIPTSYALSRVLHYDPEFISQRIESNPVLFLALAAKQGLTPDQAVELALERDDKSYSVSHILKEHL